MVSEAGDANMDTLGVGVVECKKGFMVEGDSVDIIQGVGCCAASYAIKRHAIAKALPR